jgi:hypothetical protein
LVSLLIGSGGDSHLFFGGSKLELPDFESMLQNFSAKTWEDILPAAVPHKRAASGRSTPRPSLPPMSRNSSAHLALPDATSVVAEPNGPPATESPKAPLAPASESPTAVENVDTLGGVHLPKQPSRRSSESDGADSESAESTESSSEADSPESSDISSDEEDDDLPPGQFDEDDEEEV